MNKSNYLDENWIFNERTIYLLDGEHTQHPISLDPKPTNLVASFVSSEVHLPSSPSHQLIWSLLGSWLQLQFLSLSFSLSQFSI